MADFHQVGKQFVDFYYQSFDRDRSSLLPLYRDTSMLTFEGDQIMSASAIIKKLAALPFAQVQHRVDTIDVQPSNPGMASMLVMVTGALLVDDSQNPIHFCQTFQLVPEASSYYVLNDVFRLNYG